MNKVLILFMAFVLASCAQMENHHGESSDQKEIFKSWVLSRCLSYTYIDGEQKQDVLNTASAYLEQSILTVEQLLRSDPLINDFLSKKYRGSIDGTFNTMKCIDLFNSSELDALYRSFNK